MSGAAALRSLWHFTERYDVKISLARVHQHAREILEADGIIDDLGEEVNATAEIIAPAPNPARMLTIRVGIFTQQTISPASTSDA